MENFIFPKRLEQQLKDFIDYPESIPNILCFYGIPAQGKTSFAKYLAKQVANEVNYFDANSHLLENHDASYVAKTITAMNCNGQVKQDTLLSRLFIKFPLILNRGLIA